MELSYELIQINNENFVLRGERFASERIIILGKKSLLKSMCENDFFFMDGTLQSVLKSESFTDKKNFLEIQIMFLKEIKISFKRFAYFISVKKYLSN